MNIQLAVSPGDISDKELVSLVRDGSANAFTLLSERYMPVVKNRARRYSNVVGVDPEDFVQEGMLALFKAVKGFDECIGGQFRPYAVTCINNSMTTAIKIHMKNLTRNSSACFDGSGEISSARPKYMLVEDMYIEQEDFILLTWQLQSLLSDFERRILSLYLRGYSYLKISRLLSTSTKAVDNALQRIRRKLKPKLQ